MIKVGAMTDSDLTLVQLALEDRVLSITRYAFADIFMQQVHFTIVIT
jgi:hypothetical protein